MKIIAANFKSFLTPRNTSDYINDLESGLSSVASERSLQFVTHVDFSCPPACDPVPGSYLSDSRFIKFIVFPNQSSLVDQHCCKRVCIGAQNAYPAVNGAFTGEIGLEVLDSMHIRHILIGHSERRRLLGESNSAVIDKFRFFKEHGFLIVLCVGEDMDSYRSGNTESFLLSQLSGIDLDYDGLVVAYEPVWAIGSGISASMDYICKVIRSLRAEGIRSCLYGGSVNSSNAVDICGVTDGLLIGSFSLKAQNMIDILRIV